MKPIRLAVGSVLIAFVALGAGSSLLGQEGALRYRWNKGDVLRYRVVQTTNAAMSGIPGMGEMNVTNTMTQVQQFTTTDVAADGAATLQVKFESLKMEMGTPMGTFVYDSGRRRRRIRTRWSRSSRRASARSSASRSRS